MRRHSLNTVKWLFIPALALVMPAATICWAKNKTTLSPAAEAGKKIFDQNCALCHFPNQTSNKIGPGMQGVLKNKELPYSHRPATVANVQEQIEKGNPEGKPMPMPAFSGKLSKEQISDLIEYLKTL
ncbi:MAG: c-type cytochrome [Acidobacteria bacterium]|nr:MAG: c-type cytochrome [Acidobacteriota bacterium]